MSTAKKFIATDREETAIYGVGDTAERAELDAMRGVAGSVESYRYYQKVEPESHEGFITFPATEALAKAVQEQGGNIAWDELPDGTQCTVKEFEAGPVGPADQYRLT